MPTKRRRRLIESTLQKRARPTRRIGNGVAEYYRVILRSGSVPGRREDGIVLPAIVGAAVALMVVLLMNVLVVNGALVDMNLPETLILSGGGLGIWFWMVLYFAITPFETLRFPKGKTAILKSMAVVVGVATLMPVVMMLTINILLIFVDVALVRNNTPQFGDGFDLAFWEIFLGMSFLSLPGSLAAACLLFLKKRNSPLA